MTSPNGGATIDCHPSNVKARLAAGWTKVEDKKESETKKNSSSVKDK